jgi:hypothetical protein
MDHTGLGDGSDTQNENRILKGLLNQDDKDEARGDDSTTMRSSPGSRHVGARSASSANTPKVSTNNNNMLLKVSKHIQDVHVLHMNMIKSMCAVIILTV